MAGLQASLLSGKAGRDLLDPSLSISLEAHLVELRPAEPALFSGVVRNERLHLRQLGVAYPHHRQRLCQASVAERPIALPPVGLKGARRVSRQPLLPTL